MTSYSITKTITDTIMSDPSPQTLFSSTLSTTTSTTPTTISTSTVTTSSSILTVGQSSNGPAEVAFTYCFPSKFPDLATDVPCYSMEVLNQACYYGPGVFATATATPSAPASPQDQYSCYCDEDAEGYMYFEYMNGCGRCFRSHGALGLYGAYQPTFISLLSSAYCGQNSPSLPFGHFMTSLQSGEGINPSLDLATTNVLGTKTDVELYFTTSLSGAFALASEHVTTPTPATNTSTSAVATSAVSPSSNSISQSAKINIGVGVGVGVGGALILGSIAVFLLRHYIAKKVRSARSQRYDPGIADDEPGVAVSTQMSRNQSRGVSIYNVEDKFLNAGPGSHADSSRQVHGYF